MFHVTLLLMEKEITPLPHTYTLALVHILSCISILSVSHSVIRGTGLQPWFLYQNFYIECAVMLWCED